MTGICRYNERRTLWMDSSRCLVPVQADRRFRIPRVCEFCEDFCSRVGRDRDFWEIPGSGFDVTTKAGTQYRDWLFIRDLSVFFQNIYKRNDENCFCFDSVILCINGCVIYYIINILNNASRIILHKFWRWEKNCSQYQK